MFIRHCSQSQSCFPITYSQWPTSTSCTVCRKPVQWTTACRADDAHCHDSSHGCPRLSQFLFSSSSPQCVASYGGAAFSPGSQGKITCSSSLCKATSQENNTELKCLQFITVQCGLAAFQGCISVQTGTWYFGLEAEACRWRSTTANAVSLQPHSNPETYAWVKLSSSWRDR